MLANLPGVEFLRTIKKFRKRTALSFTKSDYSSLSFKELWLMLPKSTGLRGLSELRGTLGSVTLWGLEIPYSTRKIAWNPDETRHLQESKWKSLSMNLWRRKTRKYWNKPEIFLLGNFFPVQNNEAKNVQGKHGDSKSYDDWNKKLFCFGVLSFS